MMETNSQLETCRKRLQTRGNHIEGTFIFIKQGPCLIPAQPARCMLPSKSANSRGKCWCIFPFRWTTDREDLGTTDRVFHPREDLDAPDWVPHTWYARSELVTVLVEYLKCALKAIKRLARAHSDLIVGVFVAGQPIHTDIERRGGKRRKTECRGGKRRKTERRRRSISERR
ncbi:hypothetical protein LR48_Vigan03g315200 [Vigna angularis]|uniref:Uncharacterized protein n=1 Tax=Phaseolus angularis TaxID=3914 RepID=A0A0L9UA25_PHAAN|nr:hypothetical protein LR48_Vigan03g315200 [Vigna angularis]